MFFHSFFTYSAPSQTYTLSLHDALPISHRLHAVDELSCSTEIDEAFVEQHVHHRHQQQGVGAGADGDVLVGDRKSTRLNSSHRTISYAVFCLKKKKKKTRTKNNTIRNTS